MTEKGHAEKRVLFGASKPVSRVLSFKTAIYLDVPLPTRSSHLPSTTGPAMRAPAVLLRIEFTAMDCSQPSGGILPPPFHPYPASADSLSVASPQAAKLRQAAAPSPKGNAGRYLSVALFLGSPPAGVTRYPCPVEPGLSSEQAFQPRPAAAQLACCFILSYWNHNVKPVFIEIFCQMRYNVLATFRNDFGR